MGIDLPLDMHYLGQEARDDAIENLLVEEVCLHREPNQA